MTFNQQVNIQLQYCVINCVREEALDSCGVGGTEEGLLNSFQSGVHKGQWWDLPGGVPVVKTQCPWCRGRGFDPRLGNKIAQPLWAWPESVH